MTIHLSSDAKAKRNLRRHESPTLFALLLAAAASMQTNLLATTVTSTWTGVTDSNWSNAANWSPNTADPSNGNAGFSDYNAVITHVTGGASPPLLDITATIDNLTLNPNATLTLGSAQTLNVSGSTLTNNGTMTLLGNSTLGTTSLNLTSAATTLSGGGTIVLTNSTFSRIGGNLTNVDNTIEGAGILLSAVTNQATILVQGGTLTLNGNVDNTAGNISVAANGTLAIGSQLTGGTLATVVGSQIINGALSNVTLSNSSVWSVLAGTASPTLANTFTNHGTINVSGNSTFGTASLTLAVTGTILNGGGTLTLTDSTFSRISGGTLTNVNNTIQGAGIIISQVANEATIRAQGGTLTFNGNITNTGGTVIIAANGTLALSGTQLTGGTVTAVAGSQITGSGSIESATVSGSLIATGGGFSNVTLSNASSLTVQINTFQLSGAFANSGTVTVLGNSTIGTASIVLPTTGTVTLTGDGTVALTDSSFSRIIGGTLANVDNIIRGAGIITSVIINQATILPENGTLTLNGNVDNTAGDVLVSANGTMILGGTTLTGGNITTFVGSQITGGTLSNVTLTTGSVWNVQSATASPALAGTFTNHGTVSTLGNSTLGTATLNIDAAGATLNGGGTITLTNGTFSRISGGNLTNVDNNIRGAGIITSNVTNQATIIAENGTLTLNGNVANTGGMVSVAADGTLTIGATLTGGNITTVAGSQIAGGTLSNVTLTTGSIWNVPSATSSPTLAGTFTNHGTVTVLGNSTLGAATLTLPAAGTVSLAGGGTIVLSDGTFSRISAGNLTNLDNTIRGAGIITAAITNQGAIIAQGGNLTLNGDVSGSGNITVIAGASMSAANLTQAGLANNGSFTMTGNGTLGSVRGIGTLTLSNSHLVIFANSPTSNQSGLVLGGTSTIDLNNNKLVIQPTADSKSIALASLQSEFASHSLFSSTLPSNFALVLLDNAVTHFNTFGGLPVDTNSLLLSPELLGDANVDGHVDLTDLSTILNNFGAPTPAWTSGNFDGATTIDLTDLSTVLNNFGLTIPNANISDFSLQTSAFSPAPEPATLMLSVFAALLLTTKRRRPISSH